MFDQLGRMRNNESGHIPILLIHGPFPPTTIYIRKTGSRSRARKRTINETEREKRTRTMIAAVNTAIHSFGVTTICFYRKDLITAFLADLFYRQTKKKSSKPIQKLKATTPEDYKWNMLSQLPGIGTKGSTTLCESGLSIYELSQLSAKDFVSKFKGIGKKRAKAIVEVLNL